MIDMGDAPMLLELLDEARRNVSTSQEKEEQRPSI